MLSTLMNTSLYVPQFSIRQLPQEVLLVDQPNSGLSAL
jgi:hypothetical protein